MGFTDFAKWFAGRVYRFVVRRPLQRYNVENRAFKLLDKYESGRELPKPAPKQPPIEEYIKKIEQGN